MVNVRKVANVVNVVIIFQAGKSREKGYFWAREIWPDYVEKRICLLLTATSLEADWPGKDGITLFGQNLFW
ncbi:MAG: hypothetical protein DYG98_20300 [Haliscomenobacteraceae bacterium CHB4]|nr:hypothetical protein [Haliscomenobacteraceae bacterium CHB4]